MTATDEPQSFPCGCPTSNMQSHACLDPDLHRPEPPYVAARDLWWMAPEVCTCPDPDWCAHDTTGGWYPSTGYVGGFSSFDDTGTTYITDGLIALPDNRFVGLDDIDRDINPLSDRMAAALLDHLLNGRVLDEAPTRVFREPTITVLEKAGFRIRPLAGTRTIHAICDPTQQWDHVGLIASSRPGDESTAQLRPAVTEAP